MIDSSLVHGSSVRVAIAGRSHVLITGPTGSGKSRLARELHERGPRAGRAFINVNLATLHEGTLESELFGHERGAYTGADVRRIGKLEQAQGGTVFLDEIGELSPRLQARLLEFLQTGRIRPLGSAQELRLDVRVIAATHRPLRRLIAEGAFREDLYHRLCVAEIELPSLKSRAADFDSIVHQCIDEIAASLGRKVLGMSEEFARRLECHDWPGNYRELRNVLEFAIQASSCGMLRCSDLPPSFTRSLGAPLSPQGETLGAAEPTEPGSRYESALARFERDYLVTALRRTGGRVNRTAREIGINKATLIRRIRKHGIDVRSLETTNPAA